MPDQLDLVMEDLRGRPEFRRTYSTIRNYIEARAKQVAALQEEVNGLRTMGKEPESLGEMKFVHQEAHLCYRCAHQGVCKVPSAIGDMFATVVNCEALVDTSELQEAIDSAGA